MKRENVVWGLILIAIGSAFLLNQFMPGLFAFAYPVRGRQFKRARRIAFKAWAFAFHVRVRMLDA